MAVPVVKCNCKTVEEIIRNHLVCAGPPLINGSPEEVETLIAFTKYIDKIMSDKE